MAGSKCERDEIFKEQNVQIGDFSFGKDVARVFDDMLVRSVPMYAEIQRMITEMATDLVVDGTNIYDLGCSTGTTLLALDRCAPPGVKFIGVDNSKEMLDKCREKLGDHGFGHALDLVQADLNKGIRIENASLVLMVLTLQFIRPLYRERLIADIYQGINHNGALILVEKVLGEDSFFNRTFIRYYYDYKKRNGYSEIEISQKREALENVLIPYKLLENRQLLLETGFRYCEVFFKWYNFCGMVAVK